MSRIGKRILYLNESTMTVNKDNVVLSGVHGVNTVVIPEFMTVLLDKDPKIEKNNTTVCLTIENPEDNFQCKMWGTVNALINGAIEGVNKGFTVTIEFVGKVGYNYEYVADANVLKLHVGYSNHRELQVPKNIIVVQATKGDRKASTELVLKCVNHQCLKDFAAVIIKQRPMSAYHNRGIKFKNVTHRIKEMNKK